MPSKRLAWAWVATLLCATNAVQSAQIRTSSLVTGINFLPKCDQAILAPAAQSSNGTQGASGASTEAACTDGDPNLPFLKLTNTVVGQDAGNGYYVFKNVRYTEPRVNTSRWRPPIFWNPGKGDAAKEFVDIELSKKRIKCIQAPGGTPSFSNTVDEAVSDGLGFGKHSRFGSQPMFSESEDCLFMDVYMEQDLVRNLWRNPPAQNSLPSPPNARSGVIYFHGGPVPFGSGSKEDFHLGEMLEGHRGATFFVVNSRLGAFGYLSDPNALGSLADPNVPNRQVPRWYRDAQSLQAADAKILPNLGLIDQEMAMEVAKSIATNVGTYPQTLTLWGREHGATMALYHASNQWFLMWFKKVIAESPILHFSGQTGPVTSDQFEKFVRLVGCEGKSSGCLREAPIQDLQRANAEIYKDSTNPLILPYRPTTNGIYETGMWDGGVLPLIHPAVAFYDAPENASAWEEAGKAFDDEGLGFLSGRNRVERVIISSHLEQNKFLINATEQLFAKAGPPETFIEGLDPSKSVKWKQQAAIVTDKLLKLISDRKFTTSGSGPKISTPEFAAEYISMSQRCMLNLTTRAYPKQTWVASFQNTSPGIRNWPSQEPTTKAPASQNDNCLSNKAFQQTASIWQSYLLGMVDHKDVNAYIAPNSTTSIQAAIDGCKPAERPIWGPAAMDTPKILQPVLTIDRTRSPDFKVEGLEVDEDLCTAWVELFRG